MHIDHTRLRVVAETAVKCDDRPPPNRPSPQNSRKRAGTACLDWPPVPCDPLQCCILMLIGAPDGIIMFAFISATIHIVPATTTNTMRTPKASASTLLVLSGPLVMCRKNTRWMPIWAIASTTSPVATPGPHNTPVDATQNDRP